MGKLVYGSPETEIEFEDRLLAHLQRAIIAQLRRGESFAISWQEDKAQGGGRRTLWLHPAIPLQFVFDESEQPEFNRRWVEALIVSGYSAHGLYLVPEPELAP
ncbi:hypothetical protein [Salinibacterium sp. ZJ450]|uniref:DUF7882 family protein n=1 Tax=Salinibacterium sp. ZJ450 TaxID=2708338 RepID=UPI00141F8EB4|nr:hypothetical protein [Salinibacterium sp. ZJ450]